MSPRECTSSAAATTACIPAGFPAGTATSICSRSTATSRFPTRARAAQPYGVRGASRGRRSVAIRLDGLGWRGLTLDELVIYELHVGTFTEEGTFDASIPRLAALRELGVTAIEVMPIATFPGERGWGYDGLYTFAPHPAYGGPEAFARLVDAAHGAGLGVHPRRRLQPCRPRQRGVDGLRRRTSRTGTRRSGATRSTTRRGRARVGGPERGALDPRLPRRRAAARRRARDLRRLADPHLRGAQAARGGDPRSSSPRWRPTTCARSRNGVTTRSGSTAPPRAARAAHRRARGLLRELRLGARARRELRAAATTRGASSSARRTTTRSATARSATGCRAERCASPPR